MLEFTEEIDFEIPAVQFALNGRRTKPPHEAWREEFTLLPAVPHAALSALTSLITTDNRGRARANAAAINAFFTQSLTDESADRYLTLVNDNDRIVSTNKLADIINKIVEETSGRPTQPSSGSSLGITNGSTGATDISPIASDVPA